VTSACEILPNYDEHRSCQRRMRAERAKLWKSSVIGASGRGAFRHKSGAGFRMAARLARATKTHRNAGRSGT
jgi:hypothetical protein